MEVAVSFVQGTALRYVNPAAGRMTGYTREELLAMQAGEFIHPDHRAIVRERVIFDCPLARGDDGIAD